MAEPYLPTSTAESAARWSPWKRREFVQGPPAKARYRTFSERRRTPKLSESDVKAIRTWRAQHPHRSDAELARELAASGVWPVGRHSLYEVLRGETFMDIKPDPVPFVPSGVTLSPRFAWLLLWLMLAAGASASQALRTLCLAQLCREEDTSCVAQS